MPLLDFRVCGVRAGEPVTTTAGVRITPEHGLDGLRGADLVAVPATALRSFPEAALAAVRDAHAAGATLLTVCSGVFVLGAAGLLDGRKCSVHWKSVDELREELERVREQGFALDDEEQELGVRCVAVPVATSTPWTQLAMSVSGPTERMSRERAVAVVPDLRRIAEELGRRELGA